MRRGREISKEEKGKRQMEERLRRASETDRESARAQAHNLISFLACQWLTGELAELRV